MASKSKKRAAPSEIQLRQWCISMALGWPSWEEQYINQYAGAQSNLGSLGGTVRTRKDADVIGGDKAILAWVTEA